MMPNTPCRTHTDMKLHSKLYCEHQHTTLVYINIVTTHYSSYLQNIEHHNKHCNGEHTQSILLLEELCAMHKKEQLRRCRLEYARNRTAKVRTSWTEFANSLTDRHFRRMFRMERQCFLELCEKIEKTVGGEEFKSEEYINMHLSGDTATNAPTASKKQKNMYNAHKTWSGGYICGEIKVAIMLRFMGGGHYADLAKIFEIYYTASYLIFHQVLQQWICRDEIYPIIYDKQIRDENNFTKYQSNLPREGMEGFLQVLRAPLMDGWCESAVPVGLATK